MDGQHLCSWSVRRSRGTASCTLSVAVSKLGTNNVFVTLSGKQAGEDGLTQLRASQSLPDCAVQSGEPDGESGLSIKR